jgi:hypothetical protein
VSAAVRYFRCGNVDAAKAALFETKTQVNVFKKHKVPLVEPSHSVKSCPANEKECSGEPPYRSWFRAFVISEVLA